MAIRLKWFNKEGISGGTFLVNIKDGATYTDNFNEELDSATVILTLQENKIAFEPFDVVELYLPIIGTKTMLIDDFVENELDIDNHIYEYTLNLMSKTKELERVPLPNLSITKAKDLPAKDIGNVIDELLTDYSPLYKTSGNTLSKKYRFPYIEDRKCPDLQMSKPTLREAIDRTLSSINSICYLDNDNDVLFMDLNSRGKEIDIDEHYNYQPENQSSNDYATESENNYNNVVPNYINQWIKNDTEVTEYIGFRTEDLLLTDNNATLITNNPIYDLKKVLWCGGVWFRSLAGYTRSISFNYKGNSYTTQLPNTNAYYLEIDITNYILEEQDFNIKSYEDKKHFAYYSRGNNKIEGLLNFKKNKFVEEFITLPMIIENSLHDDGSILLTIDDVIDIIQITVEDDNFDPSQISDVHWIIGSGYAELPIVIDLYRNTRITTRSFFKIIYEAQNENLRIRSSKYLPERNQDNIIVDNPSEAFVDIKRQGELFNQKCNRLGNRVKYINARFPIRRTRPISIEGTIPDLSDYIDNKVLIRRELQFYDDYILFKGTLTENYVNINYFTGVNARKRTYNIISASEAFDKELLDKWFCVLSFNQDEDYTHDPDMNIFLPVILLNVFNYGPTHPIASHAWFHNDYTGHYEDRIELDLTSYISGNSLIFNCKTDDNYSAGICITNANATGGSQEGYLKYVDNNGFANNFTIQLITDYSITGIPEIGDTIVDATEPSWEVLESISYNKPLLRDATSEFDIYAIEIYSNQFSNHKDSREKLGFNIQFEFCSDTEDIIIGQKFLERQQLINTGYSQGDIYIYGNSEKYKITEKEIKPNSYRLTDTDEGFSVTRSGDLAILHINQEDFIGDIPDDIQSIVITEGGTDLIMAINVTKTQLQNGLNIYLNMQRTRDRNRYLNKDLKTWQ